MDSEFGKDFGLIHELVVTGRKAKMTAKEYTFLAHNKSFFTQIALLVRHQAVLTKFADEVTPVCKDAAEKLIQDIGSICKNCYLPGTIGHNFEAWPLFLPFGYTSDLWSGYENALSKYKEITKLRTYKDTEAHRRKEEWLLDFHNEFVPAFGRMLCHRLEKLGMHWFEIVEFMPAFSYKGLDGLIPAPNYHGRGFDKDYKFDEFAKDFRQVVKQHNILALLNLS